MHNKAFSVILFLFVWHYECCLCKPAIVKSVSPVRNPSDISHCAEGIFFQDSLFCILCVLLRCRIEKTVYIVNTSE